MIFHLPNGMQGYYLADAAGRRIDKGPSDVVFDRTNPTSPEIVVGRSCMSCHADGMKRFRDDVRPVLVRRPLSEERETALMPYAGQADLDRLLDEDESRFRRALFDATGERPSETVREPIGRVANAYQAPLGFRRAAAELGDQPTRLSTRLDFNQRRGRLLGLDALTVEGGTVSRDSWEGTFKEAVRAFDLGDIHDRYLSRMDAVIRNLPSAGARCSAVTLRSPSVFANQVTRSTSHVTRHPCARIGSPHLSGGGPSRKIQFGFSGPPASKQTIRTHQRFPRKLSRKPLRVVPHRRGPAGSS